VTWIAFAKRSFATERMGASGYGVLASETDTTAANLLRAELVVALSELYDYAARPDFKFDSVFRNGVCPSRAPRSAASSS
jgi:hypothetical protein